MEKEPDKSSIEPKKHTSEEVGAHRNGALILATDPSRSHLRYALPVPDNVEDFKNLDAPPDLGLFLDALQWFQPLALKWMQALPSVSRIAFGGRLLWHVGNIEQGNELLDKLLPDVKVAPQSQELKYRINRPRVLQIGTEKFTVNRVSSWEACRVDLEQIQDSVRTVLSTFYAVRAELDISTEPSRTAAFSQEQFTALFGKFVNFAVEIAEQGDVP